MRYPLIHQHDGNDCGPACLAMISAFYGRRQSIATLREAAGTTRQGTSLAGLVQAAAAAGFRPRAVRARPEALAGIPLPAIAHWREGGRNHFVVVYRRKTGHVDIGDPAVGLRRLSSTEFETCWTGTLLLLDPTPDLKSLGTSPLRTMFGLVRHHHRLFSEAVVAALLITILGLSSSFFIQALVDFVVPAGRAATLNWLAAGMLLVLVARGAFLLIRGRLIAHLAQRVDAEIVIGYHHHLLNLPVSFFSARQTGEVAARLHDAVRIRNAIAGTGLAVIVDSTTLLVTATAMLWINATLALPGLGVIPCLGIAIAALTPGLRRAQQAALERGARFEAHVVETITAIQSVRTSRAEGWMRMRAEHRFAELLESVWKSDIYRVWASTAATVLAGIGSLALLWSGGHAVMRGEMTPGALMALYTLFGMVVGPVERLAGANQAIQEALVASGRVGEVLALPPESGTRGETGVDHPIRGQIEFERVRFRYGTRPPVVDDLTLEIPAGECCRIAGASGSGKSTLVRLLVRIHDPEAGRILIDGVDVRDYSLDSLRRQVTYLSQETGLLSASIADNIRLGRPTATFGEIREAAILAGAHDFIQAAPGGYGSQIGENGLSLSGGERQRLVMARAILGNPMILILDEPTNHLDPPSVSAVKSIIEQRRLDARTTILISHDTLPCDRTVRIDA